MNKNETKKEHFTNLSFVIFAKKKFVIDRGKKKYDLSLMMP